MRQQLLVCLILASTVACGKQSNSAVKDLSQTEASKYSIFLSLSKDPSPTTPDAYRIIAASALNLDANSIQFCLSTLALCKSDLTQPKVAGVGMDVDGVKAFVSKSFIKIQNNTQITLMAKDALGVEHFQTIKITDPTAVPTQP
jgi:hypothetical protein